MAKSLWVGRGPGQSGAAAALGGEAAVGRGARRGVAGQDVAVAERRL